MPPIRASQPKASRQKPYKARGKRCLIPRAERQAKKALRDAKEAAVKEKIASFWAQIVEWAEDEGSALGISGDKLVEKLLALGRSKFKERKINLWNAWQHSESLKRKAGRCPI